MPEKFVNPHIKDVRQLDEFLDTQIRLQLFKALYVHFGIVPPESQHFSELPLRQSALFTQVQDSFPYGHHVIFTQVLPYGHVISPLSPCVHVTEQTWTDVVACLLLL